MNALSVFNDSDGNVYVSAEDRRKLYKLCDRLGRQRSAIRWSYDLRCFVIALPVKQGKKVANVLKLDGKTHRGRDAYERA